MRPVFASRVPPLSPPAVNVLSVIALSVYRYGEFKTGWPSSLGSSFILIPTVDFKKTLLGEVIALVWGQKASYHGYSSERQGFGNHTQGG
jgi:hypothetical protein